MKASIKIDPELCKGCSLCVSFCPQKALSQLERVNSAGYFPANFNENAECTGCAVCALVCPEIAIEVYRG